MKLEDQVCNLELSKKLKELGVKQDSYFYWEKCPGNERFEISDESNHDTITGEWGDCHLLKHQEHYSAFTPQELLELLPASIDLSIYGAWGSKNTKIYELYVRKYTEKVGGFYIEYIADWDDALDQTEDNNLSNALAKMLIYLIENNIIDVNKLNGE